MKLSEIAQKITEHLKRMENDPEINKPRGVMRSIRPFVNARAHHAGRYIGIVYQGWQVLHPAHLTKVEALQYLAWLDAGNNGYHFEAQQSGEG